MDLAKLAFGILVAIFAIALLFGAAYYGGQAVGEAIAPQEPYTISENAQGMHFYSKLHGGYSFDYPKTWELPLNKLNESITTTDPGRDFSGAQKFLKTITNNEFMSAQILSPKKGEIAEKQMLIIMFTPDEETVGKDECDTEGIRESSNTTSAIYSLFGLEDSDKARGARSLMNAEASWQKIGGIEGCLVESQGNAENMWANTALMTGDCGGDKPVVIEHVSNYSGFTADAKRIISSLRCGKDAVPN